MGHQKCENWLKMTPSKLGSPFSWKFALKMAEKIDLFREIFGKISNFFQKWQNLAKMGIFLGKLPKKWPKRSNFS